MTTKWYDDCITKQDFLELLPMFDQLDGMILMSLHIARQLATQTKQRVVIKNIKERTNIPLDRIKFMVREKTPNDLDLSYARFMFLDMCEKDGLLDYTLGLNEPSDEAIQVMMFLDWWDNL